jgi:uncharacterized damage-inducible protein DinB
MPMRQAPALLLLAALGAAPVVAQNATPSELRTEYLAHMKYVEDKVVGLAEAFPADKYAWRPGPGVRSVSEVLMHIASEHYIYLPESIGATRPADLKMGDGDAAYANLEKVTDKAEIIRHLKASFAYQRSVLEKSDAAFKTGKVMSFGKEVTANHVFIDMIADQHEHLGQLIAYARVNGIVPPWSKGM